MFGEMVAVRPECGLPMLSLLVPFSPLQKKMYTNIYTYIYIVYIYIYVYIYVYIYIYAYRNISEHTRVHTLKPQTRDRDAHPPTPSSCFANRINIEWFTFSMQPRSGCY